MTARPRGRRRFVRFGCRAAAVGLALGLPALAAPHAAPPAPARQTRAEAEARSAGCLDCHSTTDAHTMHRNPGVILGCADCHGGDPSVRIPPGRFDPADYRDDPGAMQALERAHVLPRFPESWDWPSSANPERTYTLLNRETPEFVRFVNPSDYRVAREACGACHLPVIQAAERSIMATGAMLWGGAAYNNGMVPYKRYLLGESYTREGLPAKITGPPVRPREGESEEALRARLEGRGVLPFLLPLPAWEVVPPADPLRVFERGGRVAGSAFPDIGNPNLGRLQRLEEPGRPDVRQSNRGPGTGLRVAIPVLNLHKTRLNDPLMWFMGTNDQPGDFRHSGCASCHVVYANDRDPQHSGPYSRFGHGGKSRTEDPTIPRGEPGHPLRHEFTRAVPTSQCMSCHMHQPNSFVNSFLGYTMWDYESDAPLMWPAKREPVDAAEERARLDRNPEGAVVHGRWADLEFLRNVWTDVNPRAQNTQFADYHGHGWNFRAVFKKDRHGNLLDAEGEVVPHDAADKLDRAVHMASIHAEVGMHCVDCHFSQDVHGSGHLVGEVAAAVEIDCRDCHGTAEGYPSLRTSGTAARPDGTDLSVLRTPDGRRRFEWVDGKLFQRSSLHPDREWQLSLVRDTVDPDHADFNARAARAKLTSRFDADGRSGWGPGVPAQERAHGPETMACYTCHLSWTTSCAGCHLSSEANWKTERHHFEGGETRNWASYNPQVVRDQMFQLGRHSDVKGNVIAPIRSSSALVLSSVNANRERIYVQQPPIASSGFSSQAFAPHFPHTVRRTETKTCTDCHVAEAGDNNAIMAQLLLQGTNFVNFVGHHAWVGEQGAVEAVQVTEWSEPQAVIGSYLHRWAYPESHAAHEAGGGRLETSHAHRAKTVRCLQLRGEYLYAAAGADGMRVFDVSNIANKGVSQRIVSAPFSPLGQALHVPSHDATCVVLPTTQPIHPDRNRGELMRETNREQAFHPIYDYAFVTDSREGLIATDVNTLADGEPRNNRLVRALTWNENGVLDGARHLTIAGSWFYVAARRGVVILDMDDPLDPHLVAVIPLTDVRSTAVQFRYLFVTDASGLRVIDVTRPSEPRPVEGAVVPLRDAQRVYVARTYAYVAAGSEGLAIVDVERPEAPRLEAMFDGGGRISDARDVVVGSTNASLYAYVANGKRGLAVVQLTSPESQPGYYGFSPSPRPELIAWRPTRRPALALSRGLDRDRAVDETGGQIAVFGRLGSRPFRRDEMERLYIGPDGEPYRVRDEADPARFVPAAADE